MNIERRDHWIGGRYVEPSNGEYFSDLNPLDDSIYARARKEVATATGILRAAAGATRQLSGKTMSTDVPGRMSVSTRRPIGVIAGVTPFNVPLIKRVTPEMGGKNPPVVLKDADIGQAVAGSLIGSFLDDHG